MKTNLEKIFPIILVFMFVLGCSKKQIAIPPDVISMKQMELIMTDAQLAEAAKDVSMPGDTSRHVINEYYNFIFNKYHITKDQFQHSFNFYKSNPELMNEIYTEVINRLSEIQAKPGNH